MRKRYSRRRLIAAGAGATVLAPVALSGKPAAAFEPPAGPLITLLTPIRVYDSRDLGSIGGGSRLASGSSLDVNVAGGFESMAMSVFLNCTVTDTVGYGWLTIVPLNTETGTPVTTTSNINWATSGQTLANMVLSAVGAENSVEVICGGTGATHFVIDVMGYVPFTPA